MSSGATSSVEADWMANAFKVGPFALIALCSLLLMAGNLLKVWWLYLPYLTVSVASLVLLVGCAAIGVWSGQELANRPLAVADARPSHFVWKYFAETGVVLFFACLYVYFIDVVVDGMRYVRYIRFY